MLYHESTYDHPLFLTEPVIDEKNWVDIYFQNWQKFLQSSYENKDHIVIESVLFQYPILNLLHKDVERNEIHEFIKKMIRELMGHDAILVYLFHSDQELAINKMIDRRGGVNYLKQKYEQFQHEPYYKNRGNSGPLLHADLLHEYSSLLEKVSTEYRFKSLTIEISKETWEEYQSTAVEYFKIIQISDPDVPLELLRTYVGSYGNEDTGLIIAIEESNNHLNIFGDRKLRAFNVNTFFLDDISVEIKFLHDVNGAVIELVIGEKDIYANKSDEGTTFYRIS